MKNDGNGNFGEHVLIGFGDSSAVDGSIEVTDVNGDSQLDILVLAISGDGSRISWHENTDGRGAFGAPSTIVELPGYEQRSMFLGDLDADGDKDVLFASSDAITWHDNLDGFGNFSTAKVIRSDSGANEVVAGDLDGDGDLDVLLKDDRHGYYRLA